MTEFSQDMTAIAGVLLAATSTIKAIVMCAKAFKTSVTINIDKNVWWRRLGRDGWVFIFQALVLLFTIFFCLFQLRQLSLMKSPLSTGDAADIALYLFMLFLGFYPPESMRPKFYSRTPAS